MYFNDLFWFAVASHFVGDYFLQTKNMALKKTKSWWVCFKHCLLYTLSFAVVTQIWSIQTCLFIFLTHYLIDHYSLANIYLALIKGRTFIGAYITTGPSREFDIAFTSIVYTVVDNFFIFLFYSFRYIL